MAVTSTRTEIITFTGDVSNATLLKAAGSNTAASGESQPIGLSAGVDNTITVPTGGSVPTAVRIEPPTGNTQALKLKGNAADVGVRLHNTDYTTIALDPSVSSFIINVGAGSAVNVRFTWT